jgi:protein-disulfide isomerase
VPAERQTKDQRRDAAREAARIAREKQKKSDARNRILFRGGVTLGAVAVLALIAFVIYQGVKPPGPGPLNMASDGIVLTGSDGEITQLATDGVPSGEDPTPTDPEALDRDLHIVTYIDFFCPFCKAFETANAEYLKELVADGTASLEIHPIAILDPQSLGTRYSTRAANAAACVANYNPGLFLDAMAGLFERQPAEKTEGLTNDELIGIVGNAGVRTERMSACINDEPFKAWVADATQRALDGPLPNTEVPKVGGTPTVLVNGVAYEGSPEDGAAFQAFVEEQLAAVTADDE